MKQWIFYYMLFFFLDKLTISLQQLDSLIIKLLYFFFEINKFLNKRKTRD